MANVATELADKILINSIPQLQASRRNKRARFDVIKENENLYLGIVEMSIRNPFNECFPFMAGFIDHFKAEIEDDSMLTFGHQAEADLKKAQRIQGMYDRVSSSNAPNDSWPYKHRTAKSNALFSGRALYKFFAIGKPEFKSFLKTVSHWDFHNEPRGGGQLENHLFCGEDSVFRTIEALETGDQYEQDQVTKLANQAKNGLWKDNRDYESDRNNRARALGQDPESNNYVGTGVVKLVEWYTTYNGKRYYILFNENANVWVRCELLTDIFPDNLWPYASWATNEDPDVFWSKAPADDARPMARIINLLLNQELYNREKRNSGQRAFDVEMFPNVGSLANWRPDGLIPVSRKPGEPISAGLFEMKVGDLTGTIDLATFIDQFAGRKLGNTSSVEGDAAADKPAAVFNGEIQQADKLIGIKNKSYYDCLSHLGYLFKRSLDQELSTEEAVKIMGAKGVEWVKLTPDDMKLESKLTIIPTGGSSAQALERAKAKEKVEVLSELQAVNQQWKERQMLLGAGFDESEVKEAFSQDDFATRELLSEAAQAEKDIVEGKKPKKNRGATAAYMQHIVDFATDTEDLDQKTYDALMAFALAHAEIAAENMMRNVKQMIAARAQKFLSTGEGPAPAPNAMMGSDGPAPATPSTQSIEAPAAVPVVGQRS